MSLTRERVQKQGRSRTALVVRVVGGGVAVGSMIAIVGSTGVASAADDQKVHKSYVCKYVSKPGEAERLQTGQNPIWVDNHSLFRSPEAYNAAGGWTYVGQQFNDRQIRSVVIVANTQKLDPEPSVSACAPPTPPPSTTTTKPPPSTTTTKPPPSTTTTKPPPSTTTTHTSPPSTGTTTTSAAPVSTATTYPLQPVKAGVTTDPGTSAPNTAGWLAAALLGLAALVTGGRLPRVMRKGNGSE